MRRIVCWLWGHRNLDFRTFPVPPIYVERRRGWNHELGIPIVEPVVIEQFAGEIVCTKCGRAWPEPPEGQKFNLVYEETRHHKSVPYRWWTTSRLHRVLRRACHHVFGCDALPDRDIHRRGWNLTCSCGRVFLTVTDRELRRDPKWTPEARRLAGIPDGP